MSLNRTSLRGDAVVFVPGKLMHSKLRLNPQAHVFRPTPGRNVFAKPFASAKPTIPAKHSAQVTADSTCDLRDKTHPPQYQDCLEITNETGPPLSQSITRSWAESGQFIRRTSPAFMMPLPSSFPIQGGLKPRSISAGKTVYYGGLEDSKQLFKISQATRRELHCDWKGDLLCANGEEFPKNFDDMSFEQQEAEIRAKPPTVHHFNWLGDAVPFKTCTPPAISLTVIMSLSNPKGLVFGSFSKELRKSVLFKEALHTIDPVYYWGDNSKPLSMLTGTKLQEYVAGDVARIYSKNGTWFTLGRRGYDRDEDLPEEDPMDELDYRDEDIILNGWYSCHGFPTSRDFIQLDSAANETRNLEKKLSVLRKMSSHAVKSHLEQVSSVGEIETPTTATEVLVKPLQDFDDLQDWADEADNMIDPPAVDIDWRQRILSNAAHTEQTNSPFEHCRKVSASTTQSSVLSASDAEVLSLSVTTASDIEQHVADDIEYPKDDNVVESNASAAGEDQEAVDDECDVEHASLDLETESESSESFSSVLDLNPQLHDKLLKDVGLDHEAALSSEQSTVELSVSVKHKHYHVPKTVTVRKQKHITAIECNNENTPMVFMSHNRLTTSSRKWSAASNSKVAAMSEDDASSVEDRPVVGTPSKLSRYDSQSPPKSSSQEVSSTLHDTAFSSLSSPRSTLSRISHITFAEPSYPTYGRTVSGPDEVVVNIESEPESDLDDDDDEQTLSSAPVLPVFRSIGARPSSNSFKTRICRWVSCVTNKSENDKHTKVEKTCFVGKVKIYVKKALNKEMNVLY